MLNVGGFRLHQDLVNTVFILVLLIDVDRSMLSAFEEERAVGTLDVSLADMNSFDVVQNSLTRG